MKIVINKCYGGFSLSPAAVRKLAELNGRKCYFFKDGRGRDGHINFNEYVPADEEDLGDSLMFYAFDIPNPNEVLKRMNDHWSELTPEEREASNESYSSHSLDNRDIDRADKNLVKVVEYLGERANGRCAKLAVVEVPDGTRWTIEECDGQEWVAEEHRTWA